MANTRITELDFDQIKNNLKEFLRSQDEFTDFDYEGAGITQILNILALNTHYNAYLANAAFNEVFLDSAIKRGNAASRAKGIGYTPRSAQSATAVVDIDVLNPTSTPVALSLDRFTQFNTNIGGTGFTFYNIEAVSTSMEDGIYSFADVKLYEGRKITNTFVYGGGRPYFTIQNADIDLQTLSVVVQKSGTDTFREKFNFTDEIVGVTAESPVFFVQETNSEKYELYFGDGAIGRGLVPGNIVELTYLVSSKNAANVSSAKFSQAFSYSGDIGGNTDIMIRTISNSIGGAEKEGIDSIKFNAPLSLSRGKRMITSNDYLSALSERAASVEAVSVWGGEDNDPPTYGKVFISLKPYDGYVISNRVKDEIRTGILAKQGGMLVTPVFVDPEYIHISLDIRATYDPYKTSVSSDDIAGYITGNVQTYFTDELSKYKNKFYFSKLQRLIDDSNDSIIGNIMTMTVQKRMAFPYNIPTSIQFRYGVPLKPGSMVSNAFTYSTSDRANVVSIFMDDGLGNVSVLDMNSRQVIAPSVGTVNYETGRVDVSDFVITGLLNEIEDIRVNFSPSKAVTDIDTNRNQIILLDNSTKIGSANIDSGLKVSVVATKS